MVNDGHQSSGGSDLGGGGEGGILGDSGGLISAGPRMKTHLLSLRSNGGARGGTFSV